jgi:hypothetical protein
MTNGEWRMVQLDFNKLGNVDAETCFGLAETGSGRQKRQVGASIPSATAEGYLPQDIEKIQLNLCGLRI